MTPTNPTPDIIRLFITKAIADETTKNIELDQPLTFGLMSNAIIYAAITKACDEYEKHGIYAGLIGDKNG